VRGQADIEVHAVVDLDAGAHQVLERSAPDVEHGVSADQRIAQRGGLLGEHVLGLVAVLGGGQVQVARDAHQLVARDGLAGAAAARGHVGLHGPEIATAMEDDGQRVAQRERRDAQRDGSGGFSVDQGPSQQVLCVVFFHLDLLQRSSSLVPLMFTAVRSE